MMQNKILIVDDDGIVLEVLKGTLSKKYELVTTTDSQKAWNFS